MYCPQWKEPSLAQYMGREALEALLEAAMHSQAKSQGQLANAQLLQGGPPVHQAMCCPQWNEPSLAQYWGQNNYCYSA